MCAPSAFGAPDGVAAPVSSCDCARAQRAKTTARQNSRAIRPAEASVTAATSNIDRSAAIVNTWP